METRGRAIDRHGRVWEARVLDQEEQEEADFVFWFEGMTPEDRVRAVGDCLLSSLKARGVNAIPRLRRVCRVVESERR